ncbi:MAG TPA: FAD-dependent oxidoreductase [Gemmatimonadaceae bacterium]|nr:FAD-dependent oxidoreductase [Gemmatimonadaceae bacterium]
MNARHRSISLAPSSREWQIRHSMQTLPDDGEPFDAIIIGGGFYGVTLALALRKRFGRVLLIERENALLKRASFANQARVHNGYHYPRSILTALRSRQNYRRFCDDFPTAIDNSFTQLYAIARRLSKVNAQQYERFCRRIGARITPAPKDLRGLFDDDLIEAVFIAEESVFDAQVIARSLTESLEHERVPISVSTHVDRIDMGSPNLLRIRNVSSGEESKLQARKVFNCTYSSTNKLLAVSNTPLMPLRHELAELALVQVPDHLKNIGITIMDGPFFSMMPFPPAGLHSFSHVRYTPHLTWTESGYAQTATPPDRTTNFTHMLRDAVRYVPSLAGTRYVQSLWETKTMLPNSEHDDSRPAVIQRVRDADVWSIVGAKIDGIYDALESIEAQLDPVSAPKSA